MNSKQFNVYLRSLSKWDFAALLRNHSFVREWKIRCLQIEEVRRKLLQ